MNYIPPVKTPFEVIRHAAQVLDRTAELPIFDNLTPVQMLTVIQACWRSEWDIFPDQLSAGQIARIVADPSYVPRFAEGRFGLEPIE